MPRPIHCILLVDDNPDDNFLHEIIIQDADVCDHVRVMENGTQALQYLADTGHPDYVRPDLILTDINLPGMDGFEFLERYSLLDDPLKSRLPILILTTSLNLRDTQRVALLPYIKGYFTKPLTTDMLHEIAETIKR
jgi:CheY-like chemotaxis protein